MIAADCSFQTAYSVKFFVTVSVANFQSVLPLLSVAQPPKAEAVRAGDEGAVSVEPSCAFCVNVVFPSANVPPFASKVTVYSVLGISLGVSSSLPPLG